VWRAATTRVSAQRRVPSLSRLRSLLPTPLVEWLRDFRSLDPGSRATFLALQLRRAIGARRDRLPTDARTVLFVCHGNILRSAFGETLLRERLAAAGVRDVAVRSAGVYARPGRGADPRGRAAAERYGASLEAHRAQPLTRDLMERSDIVFVMDRRNEADVLARHPAAAARVVLLGAFGRLPGERSPYIPDPYTGGAADVERCYERISRAVERVALAISAER
jgi:protein-tyrosine-phosphatase